MEKLIYFDVREIKEEDFVPLFDALSNEKQDKINLYKNKEDKYLSLGARLLEKKFILEDIDRNTVNNKPLTKKVKYNISHKYPYVVIYINDESDVGVDIEIEKPFEESFIDYVFSKEELLTNLPYSELWTIKEAHLKYFGDNISKMKNKYSLNIKGNRVNDLFYKTYHLDKFVISAIASKEIKASLTEMHLEFLK